MMNQEPAPVWVARTPQHKRVRRSSVPSDVVVSIVDQYDELAESVAYLGTYLTDQLR